MSEISDGLWYRHVLVNSHPFQDIPKYTEQPALYGTVAIWIISDKIDENVFEAGSSQSRGLMVMLLHCPTESSKNF